MGEGEWTLPAIEKKMLLEKEHLFSYILYKVCFFAEPGLTG